MTDLQVKYQQVKETERANLQNEQLKSVANDIAAKEAQTKLISAMAAQKQADVAERKQKFNELFSTTSAIANQMVSERDWLRGLILPTVRDLGGAGGAGSLIKGIASLIG